LPPGTFRDAYCSNRDEAVEGVIEADPVALAVRTMMSTRTDWKGTATDLLSALGGGVGEPLKRSKEWPSSAKALSGRLRRAATFLRQVGVEVDFNREGSSRIRTIHIAIAAENSGTQPSAPSASSVNGSKPNGGSGSGVHAVRTVVNPADDKGRQGSADSNSTVRRNLLNSQEKATADGTDANLTPQSVPKNPDEIIWQGRI
jgi:hypothetical protein